MGIKFKDVSHHYQSFQSKDEAINKINLDINESNEFIALVGHTGSGKSTLIQHMNALLLPTHGELLVFNQKIMPKKNKKIGWIRQKVGLVFQFPEYQLFEETVIKDIMFGPKNFKETKSIAEKLAYNAAKLVGVPEEILERSPFKISGGQMRKVAVAGILAMNPDVLVLDEPTRGLDPLARRELMETFKEIHLKENKTIVMVTHDMDLVSEYANRVIVLKEGKIVYDGSKEDLFMHHNFDTFHLDLPKPIKIMKHLHEKLGIQFKSVYNYEQLKKYVGEVLKNE